MNEFPELPDEIRSAFRGYRDAHPDPEPSAAFMPGLWQKIEARRRTAGSIAMLRRLAQTYVGLAVASALVLGFFVIPELQDRQHLQSSSYAEVIANDESQQDMAKAFTVIPASYPAAPSEAPAGTPASAATPVNNDEAPEQ